MVLFISNDMNQTNAFDQVTRNKTLVGILQSELNHEEMEFRNYIPQFSTQKKKKKVWLETQQN